jgi:hypothetical protein
MLGGLLPRAAAGAAVDKFVGAIVEFFVKLFSKNLGTIAFPVLYDFFFGSSWQAHGSLTFS